MDNELDHIIEGIESGLTGDFEIDATMLQNAMEQFKDHPAATEIARECGRILYEILPEDRKDDLHSAMEQDLDPYFKTMEHAFGLLHQGDAQAALDEILPLCKQFREGEDQGLFGDDAVNRYFNLDSLVQHMMAALSISEGQELRIAPLPFAKAYSVCASALFECGRHDEAITWLEKALRWNPFQPFYYFEISENHKAMSRFDLADQWDDRAYPYVADAIALARWYRAKGFCSVERGEAELAAAEYLVSMAYHPTEAALNEIAYIEERFGMDFSDMELEDAASALENRGVPVGASANALEALAETLRMALSHEDPELARDIASDLYDLTFDPHVADLLDELDEALNTEVPGCPFAMPEGYARLKAAPDDPEGQISFGSQTDQCVAIVHIRPLPEGECPMNPNHPEEAIAGIHRTHRENQGLIEVEPFASGSGVRGIYSIVKTLLKPSGVQYCLTLHMDAGGTSFEVQGFFEEQGITGMRDAMIFNEARESGAIGDDLKGWMQDPYNPDHDRGTQMNLSESRRYDSRFPEHPLSVCRSLVAHIIESI